MRQYKKVEANFTKIIKLIEEGESLTGSCRKVKVSRSDFHELLRSEDDLEKEKRKFTNSYTRACDMRADTIVDEVIEIADNSGKDFIKDENGNVVVNHEAIQRDRLRIDARKWVAGKMKPKKYGDKLDLDVMSGGEKISININLGEDEE